MSTKRLRYVVTPAHGEGQRHFARALGMMAEDVRRLLSQGWALPPSPAMPQTRQAAPGQPIEITATLLTPDDLRTPRLRAQRQE